MANRVKVAAMILVAALGAGAAGALVRATVAGVVVESMEVRPSGGGRAYLLVIGDGDSGPVVALCRGASVPACRQMHELRTSGSGCSTGGVFTGDVVNGILRVREVELAGVSCPTP